MPVINGIPVTLKAPDEQGNFTQIEKPVFATVRKCPELLGLLKAIGRSSIAEALAAKQAAAAAGALEKAENGELEKAAEAAGIASDKLTDATAGVFRAIREFVMAGFTGAGYTTDQAERYAALIPAERLGELRAACQLGCGPLDFTRPLAGG